MWSTISLNYSTPDSISAAGLYAQAGIESTVLFYRDLPGYRIIQALFWVHALVGNGNAQHLVSEPARPLSSRTEHDSSPAYFPDALLYNNLNLICRSTVSQHDIDGRSL